MDIHIFAVSSASSKIMSCAPTTSTTEDTVTIENFCFFSLNTCFLSYTCFLICYVVIAQIYHCLLPFSFSDSLIQDVRDLLGSGAEQPLPSHWRNRQTSSLENWTVLRPFMVNNMLSSEKPKEGVCHHCGHKAAVVMCRDCLPRSLYCTACDLSVTVQKARDPIASENRIFIWNTPKYSGCEDELAVLVQTPEHSGGADIIGRAGADHIGSAGAVNPVVQSFQPGQRIQSGPVREYTET